MKFFVNLYALSGKNYFWMEQQQKDTPALKFFSFFLTFSQFLLFCGKNRELINEKLANSEHLLLKNLSMKEMTFEAL